MKDNHGDASDDHLGLGNTKALHDASNSPPWQVGTQTLANIGHSSLNLRQAPVDLVGICCKQMQADGASLLASWIPPALWPLTNLSCTATGWHAPKKLWQANKHRVASPPMLSYCHM